MAFDLKALTPESNTASFAGNEVVFGAESTGAAEPSTFLMSAIRSYIRSGLVAGPATSVDNAIARYDGTTGLLIQSSSATLDDVGGIAAASLASQTRTLTQHETITIQPSTPDNPPAGSVRVFARDVSGVRRMAFVDQDGNVAEVSVLTGNMIGSGTSLDNQIPRYNGLGGRSIEASLAVVADDGSLVTPAKTEFKKIATPAAAVAGNVGIYADASGDLHIIDQVAATSKVPTRAEVNAVVSAVGAGSGTAHLGTFTGATISDNQTAKQALQSLETALEAAKARPNALYAGAPTHAISFGQGALSDPVYDATGGTTPGLVGILAGTDCIGIGRDALGAPDNRSTLCIAIGPLALSEDNHNYADVAIGFRTGKKLIGATYTALVGIDCFPVATVGKDGTAIGAHAGTNKSEITASFVGGTSAAYAGGFVRNSVIIGANSADGDNTADVYNIDGCVIVGNYAGRRVSGPSNMFLGNFAGGYTIVSGGYNCGQGRSTLSSLTSGSYNFAGGDSANQWTTSGNFNSSVGYNSGPPSAGGGYSNTTCLGANSTVTGANQVQLGDASTVTYAYGAVQNRSDLRDKADTQPTRLGLDWIMRLKPVDYRLDLRESYREVVEVETEIEEFEQVPVIKGYVSTKETVFVRDQNGQISEREIETVTPEYETERRSVKKLIKKPQEVWHQKDGSKKGRRYHHGFIAQEVKLAIDESGIDFGGYQDHSVKGGGDVLSLGYTEFIAPIVKSIQEVYGEFKAHTAANDGEIQKLREKCASLEAQIAAFGRAA